MPQDFTHPNAQPFALEAGENALLLIHGFTGSPSHMRTVGEAAHAAGFSARGILLPGHGATVEAMEKSNDAQWWEACRAAYQEMLGAYRRVAVGGLSMGGILTLLLAEAFEPSAIILFAPAIRYKRRVNHLSPVVKRFARQMKWKPHAYVPGEFLSDYDYGYAGAPVSKVEDMTRLQRKARKALPEITCPLLVIQSHRDESVHRTGPEIITRGASSRVKEIAWVDRSRHVCTIGPDRAYVNGRVIDFLNRFGV
ncbi:MAG: alpha/beta fold hydrolase [Firmicutes bacterium]|nr:alpha/beta fold hydrolase [Bacillota bacterium]